MAAAGRIFWGGGLKLSVGILTKGCGGGWGARIPSRPPLARAPPNKSGLLSRSAFKQGSLWPAGRIRGQTGAHHHTWKPGSAGTLPGSAWSKRPIHYVARIWSQQRYTGYKFPLSGSGSRRRPGRPHSSSRRDGAGGDEPRAGLAARRGSPGHSSRP